MERRFRARLDEMLDDAEVRPGLLRGLLPRLEEFLRPFAGVLRSAEQRTNARHYVQGLLSQLGRKNAEAIAYLHDPLWMRGVIGPRGHPGRRASGRGAGRRRWTRAATARRCTRGGA